MSGLAGFQLASRFFLFHAAADVAMLGGPVWRAPDNVHTLSWPAVDYTGSGS